MLRVLVGIDAHTLGPGTVAASDVILQVVLYTSPLAATGLIDQVTLQVSVRFLCEVPPRFQHVFLGVHPNDLGAVLARARPGPDPLELPDA